MLAGAGLPAAALSSTFRVMVELTLRTTTEVVCETDFRKGDSWVGVKRARSGWLFGRT
jgi:hypothetical protein